MIRSFAKATILAVAALTAAAGVNCSSNSSKSVPSGETAENNGTVGLQLQIAPGVTISSVNYTVTGPGGFTQTGTIAVSDSTAINAVLSGLPAGTGYNIILTATAADGGITCSGAAGFDVVAHTTTSVTVHLTCQRPRNIGSVMVSGTLNICPVIDSVSATDAVNGVVQLSSSASDLDSAPSPLAFHWDVVSGPGTLDNANIAGPKVSFSAAGTVSLKLTVTDGDNATNCPDTFTTSVTSASAAVVRDAGGGAGTGGAGAGGAGTGGAGAGGAGAGGAGGGTVDAGPDVIAAGGGGAAGAAGNGGAAGTGVAGAGGTGGTDICSPLTSSTVVCNGCEANNCPHDATGCPAACSVQPACADYAAADQPLCTAVLNCIRTTNCIAGGTTSCYCGAGVSLATCQGGGAAGLCRTVIEAGLKTTAPAAILLNLTNVTLPGGGALSVGQCDHDNCGSPALGGGNECVPFCK